MSVRDTPLREATQAQLVEELARRLNKSDRDEPPAQWCEDCVHFRTSSNPSPKFNPCAKRHAMEFYVPQPHDDPHTFGYFREVCPDRQEQPEPPPAPKPEKPLTWDHPDYRMDPPPRGKPRPA